MKWFVAKLVFHISIKNGLNNSQFDEQVRLIKASSTGDAFLVAREIGFKSSSIFTNQNGETVDWKFIDVAEIYPIDLLVNGTEIFSNTIIEPEPDDYISFITNKALQFQNEIVFQN